MSLSQLDAGRAFRYGVAKGLSEYLPARLKTSADCERALFCFQRTSQIDRSEIMNAASEVAAFLAANDNRFSDVGCSISLQSDQLGAQGDSRDIIVHNSASHEVVGISAKNRHSGLKHSRLSETLDFGHEWMGFPCSQTYFRAVRPIFQDLAKRATSKATWASLPDKQASYYIPVLNAFEVEILSLHEQHPSRVPKFLLQYLLGKFDYYQVIKENGTVAITSYNVYNTLKWGNKLPMPTEITEVRRKPRSETTLLMTLDQGWQLSFRIHNASALIEPSLKFDINVIGTPSSISRNVIPYGQ